jgi:hypothetical protein
MSITAAMPRINQILSHRPPAVLLFSFDLSLPTIVVAADLCSELSQFMVRIVYGFPIVGVGDAEKPSGPLASIGLGGFLDQSAVARGKVRRGGCGGGLVIEVDEKNHVTNVIGLYEGTFRGGRLPIRISPREILRPPAGFNPLDEKRESNH